MNADRLLEHYDRIADAVDAIPKLRKFVLDLAVRGKLTQQDSTEPPASELLSSIADEKEQRGIATRLRREGAAAKSNSLQVLPLGWELTNLGAISHRIHYGFTAAASAIPTAVRMLRITDIQANAVDWASTPWCTIGRDELERYRLKHGDILVARTGGTIGKTFLVKHPPVTSVFASYLIRIELSPSVVDEYIKLFMESPSYWSQLHEGARGTGQPNINGSALARLRVLLPPVGEQRRIVAKVNELMALCDRFETARKERESARERLSLASLARLDASAPDGQMVASHTRFMFGNLEAVTKRENQIKQLREMILSLALRGRLVLQDPKEGDGTALLEQIERSRPRTGQAKESNRPRSQTSLEVPSHWTVATIDRICISVTDGDHLPPPKSDVGIPFLVIGNVRNRTIDFAGCRFVREDYFASLDSSRRPQQGDLLYTLVGSYGIPVQVVDDRPFCVQRHIGILRPSKHMVLRFLVHAMQSDAIFRQASACATGIAQKTVPLGGLRRIQIPLPPAGEQRRIAAKVDELMTLCDRLEASLAAGDVHRSRLLDALIAEALAPAELQPA